MMSRALRILLVVVALLAIPALLFPELGVVHSPVHPLALLVIALLAAFLWPSSRKRLDPVE